jgi:small subunit ribosomal protein S17e
LKVTFALKSDKDQKTLCLRGNPLGKVKTEQIKRVAKELMTRFPDKFSNNFDENKHSVNELTRGTTTRIRNQIAGYITSTCGQDETEAANENPEEQETEA